MQTSRKTPRKTVSQEDYDGVVKRGVNAVRWTAGRRHRINRGLRRRARVWAKLEIHKELNEHNHR